MRRIVAISLISGVFVASAAIGAAQTETSVTVRIAKTDSSVKPFGTVGSADSGTVVVRLYRYRDSKYRLVDVVRAPVKGDGSYRATFARPEDGDCRVKVRVAGTDARDLEDFPCYIPDFGSGTATMTALGSDAKEIDVLIADDDAERQYGLMYRPKLPAELGMAFVWDSDTSGGFWMKNTLIPLSIAFVDSNDLIVRILDMKPCKNDPCRSYDPGASYRVAVEVNRGAFEEWGISEGDRLEVSDGS